MKKILAIFALASIMCINAKADEGMWLPSLISQRITDMQEKGFRLDAEDIYSINQASLKDAVVLFGRGCTGELISSEGLLLTNHHCGYSQIQYHSSVEHDYLKDGFWAMNRSEELPNPGLSVSFLERMEDVTDRVLEGYTPDMTEEQRVAVVKKNSDAILEEVSALGNGLRGTVEALYYGNQYFLFVYRQYDDVRLVGAPPSSIGKFGGDTDNWVWPRHTGDFSMFRIYADKNNNPAPYSQDNVPYKPKKFFHISTKGVQEGDFTFIYGFPGRTQEYIHSEGVRYIEELGDPHKINLRTLRLDIMNKYQSQSQKVRIQYSSKNATVANAWKKWQGEVKGIKKMKTVQTKQAFEAAFDKWAAGGEFDGVIAKIDALYKELEPYQFATDYYSETVRAIELSNFASSVMAAYKVDKATGEVTFEAAKADAALESFYKDWYLPIDKECFVALMTEFDKNIPADFKCDYFTKQMKKYSSAEKWADAIFSKSIFADQSKLEKFLAGQKSAAKGRAKLLQDPATEFAAEFSRWYASQIQPVTSAINQDLQLAYRDYMRGQMVYCRTQRVPKAFYPDANLTLRVAYGHIKGYQPSDATYYLPSSTIKGIMEKDNPEIFDYNIPQRLRDIYAQKDYGRWADATGEVPVCFIATNHTTGGNSGSPVINADGDLIGLNFDRVWEGTMSDIVFDPEICRNISLDVRYVLFIIDKVADADHLLEEMVLVE
ncbi:MAG: S46 family peptidase [Bacteroidales bacterium]|nr:S46 family peptidase [Bacteroidales bacterium]